MPMTLEGSCHCGEVQFSVDSQTPVPYQLCACSICRKVGGYNGSVNLGAIYKTLKIKKGEDIIEKYHAIKRDGNKETTCNSERNFCRKCSTMLWLYDSTWPELVHPFASAIDKTSADDGKLPTPKEMVCIMANSKPDWVRWVEGKKKVCEGYNGSVSIEDWHKANYPDYL